MCESLQRTLSNVRTTDTMSSKVVVRLLYFHHHKNQNVGFGVKRKVNQQYCMTMTLQEQASQSDLVLLNETVEWNENDWPHLKGGWRCDHASVVLDRAVVVLGGYKHHGETATNSVLVLNLAEPNKQWREGPPMNMKRDEHAAVVCNGGIYVMGGRNSENQVLNCMEWIDVHDLLQSFLTNSSTHAGNWTTLNCRLSTERKQCCAVAVENRYIVVMGGRNRRTLPSVEVIDTRNHTVTAAPSMNVPRSFCASAVIGHRIFVVGGCITDDELDSVEYLEFASACDNQETKAETVAKVISSLTWTTHSDLRLSDSGRWCAVVAVGSCLVVAGGRNYRTVEILDTNRNRVWNLPPFRYDRKGCSMVTVANQVAVIGGLHNPSCGTLPIMDKNSWCFRRLCEPQPNGWYHSLEGMGNRDNIKI